MKRQHGTQETLLAWASALTAVAKLQAVLEVASEDWSWQNQHRALVKRTFTLLENQQEPRLLFETAQELQQEAAAAIESAKVHLHR